MWKEGNTEGGGSKEKDSYGINTFCISIHWSHMRDNLPLSDSVLESYFHFARKQPDLLCSAHHSLPTRGVYIGALASVIPGQLWRDWKHLENRWPSPSRACVYNKEVILKKIQQTPQKSSLVCGTVSVIKLLETSLLCTDVSRYKCCPIIYEKIRENEQSQIKCLK